MSVCLYVCMRLTLRRYRPYVISVCASPSASSCFLISILIAPPSTSLCRPSVRFESKKIYWFQSEIGSPLCFLYNYQYYLVS